MKKIIIREERSMKTKVFLLILMMTSLVFAFELNFIEEPVNEETGRTPTSEGSMIFGVSGNTGYTIIQNNSNHFWISVWPGAYKFIQDNVAVGGGISYGFHIQGNVENHIGLGPGLIYYTDFSSMLPSFLSQGKTFLEGQVHYSISHRTKPSTFSHNFIMRGTAGANLFFTPERAFTPYAQLEMFGGGLLTFELGLSMDVFYY
jgi:hypothetical protein